MKFGVQLKTYRAPHWKYHYVDYDGLKEHIRSKSQDTQFTQEDETRFINLLSAELEKVALFQALKLGEIQRRIEHCEHTIQQHQVSEKSSERLTLSSFVETESEINKITYDLQDLARFQRLNYTAFLKLVKKHDKHTGFTLRPYFMNQLLCNQPFHRENFALLVSRLSCLYNIVRTGTVPVVTKAQSIDSEDEDEELEYSGCIPKKTAFWVHPDCVMDLKMLILKYLPLVVYEPPLTSSLASSERSTSSSQLTSCVTSESPVSTIYLDNKDFDMYMGQIENREQSETYRLRWYGSDKKLMWVEYQQRNTQSATVDASSSTVPPSSTPLSMSVSDNASVTKHRFQIKSKYVPKLLQGTAKLSKAVDQMRRSGQKTEQEIQQFEESTRKVQSKIHEHGLQPVTQVFFNRTAFQVPGDARVRITIDTDVVMVRENPIRASALYERPWDPVDLKAENYPFPHVRDQDIVRFPYAIMQIRTLAESQEEVPGWVDRIVRSHLVEMVPNFTKDLHAISTLYESRVALLPFWLSDMDRDIRKPAMLTGGFSHLSSSQHDSNSNSGTNDTLTSGRSSGSATSLSENGSPSASSKGVSALKNKDNSKRSRKSILDSNEIYTPHVVTFDEEVLDLVANRLMLEQQQMQQQNGVDGSNSNGNALTDSSALKVKKPVVSCLKKHGSFSSMQSRNGSNEDLTALENHSNGYGSVSSDSSQVTGNSNNSNNSNSSNSNNNNNNNNNNKRTTKRVTFKRSMAQKWHDIFMDWNPFYNDEPYYYDVESQAYLGRNGVRRSDSLRAKIGRWFWRGVSGANIVLLFVGLVLSLMNLGDSMGLEAASLFLAVSCLCMGTTVWAHLIRMDGHEDGMTDDFEEDFLKLSRSKSGGGGGGNYSYASYSNTNNIKKSSSRRSRRALFNERSALLAAGSTAHASQFTHAVHHGRWIRTRFMPVLTFLSLSAVVTLNAMVQMRPYSEDIGDD
ncbi:vacuolar transporter chaperone [Lobosporangium transversale]|uniref:VTC domain-domain-containing protein n=1 Tax=Lobosporangium transversale TaxID=64571 RepID=A0A1Y2H2I7_9FUNG|nr:VTC domain-domain-containing protein [Lobosporangium transversale]KAF9898432.1 vacuolar transporter chaperone [Lobosporangium transversale]ORZ28224.1 VTC domain-domain-containing protein [Lobosporangium transversale]|eukprot:XP_021885909.1 VTC domain-domain-containing protein [Lobosporangium transversale]